MWEVRHRSAPQPCGSRLYRPAPRHPRHTQGRKEISVRHFIRALTRFQPRHDTWQSDIPAIPSCVAEESRRLQSRDNAADVVLSPRSPFSEFRPRSARVDCKKEFVPKTNIRFGKPEQKTRRCIRSAPPTTQRDPVLTPRRSTGRFEHNILQDEYFELRTMLKQSVQKNDSLEVLVSRPKGVYSHKFPTTNHRIFCVDDAVGMGYFKRFRNDLLDNLTLDLSDIDKKRKQQDEHVPQDNPESKMSARSATSVGTSVSSFNSVGEVQTPGFKLGTVDGESSNMPRDPEENSPSSKDACTSTQDDAQQERRDE